MTIPYTIVIPARYASTRLPAKPLRDILGKPMIQRVYEQASLTSCQQVVVATDDARIAESVEGFGGCVMMTRQNHPSGTDRLQEVSQRLGLEDDHIVVNVQGDEPLIPPGVIEQVARNLAARPQSAVATLSEPVTCIADFKNPNVVKVVTNNEGMALYFSRAPIPWPRDHFQSYGDGLPAELIPQRHLGIYAYRVGQLHDFVTWQQAPLEQIESLEQLRFLWQGRAIHVEEACESVPGGVDTEEDLQRVIDFLAGSK